MQRCGRVKDTALITVIVLGALASSPYCQCELGNFISSVSKIGQCDLLHILLVGQWNSTSESLDFIHDVIDYCQIIRHYCRYYSLLFPSFLNFVFNWKLGGEIERSLGVQLNFLHIKHLGLVQPFVECLMNMKDKKINGAAIALCFKTKATSQIKHESRKLATKGYFIEYLII